MSDNDTIYCLFTLTLAIHSIRYISTEKFFPSSDSVLDRQIKQLHLIKATSTIIPKLQNS